MRGQSWNWEGLSVSLQTLLFYRQWLLPRRIVRDIRDLDFGHLKKEGFIAIAFDKDNTLSAPYASVIHPPFAQSWESCLSAFSKDKIVIISNSAGSRDDVGDVHALEVESNFQVPVLRHTAKKPLGGEELLAYFKDPDPSRVLVVGDRLLTDMVFGNRLGMETVYVRDTICTANDNPMARWIRRVEHWWIDRQRAHTKTD